MKKVIATVLALCLTLSVFLCGCGSTGSGEASGSNAGTAANNGTAANAGTNTGSAGSAADVSSTPSDSDEIVLTFSAGNFAKWAVIEDFEAKHPGVRIDVDAYAGSNGSGFLTNQILHGEPSDIYMTTRFEDKMDAAAKYLVDLAPYDFVDEIATSLLADVDQDGSIYLLPLRNAVYGIFYNKTYLDQLGCELPQNYEDLVELKARCDEAGILFSRTNSMLPGGYFTWFTTFAKTGFLGSLEGRMWEKKYLAGEEMDYSVWNDTIDYLQKLADLGFFYTDELSLSGDTALDAFNHGGSLFYINHASGTLGLNEETGYEIGLMPLISEDGSHNLYYYAPSEYVGISAELAKPGNEKKLEAAVEFIKYLFAPDGQAILNEGRLVLPLRVDATISESDALYDAYKASLAGRATQQTYLSWQNLDLVVPIGTAVHEWLDGLNTSDNVLTVMKEARDETIARGAAKSYAVCEADMDTEAAAKVIGQVYGTITGTDIAIMSIADFHWETRTKNNYGVVGKLYAGNLTQEDAWVIAPNKGAKAAVLTLTGAQIHQMLADGFTIGEDPVPFPYVLVAKEGVTIEDDQEYRVVMIADGYTAEVAEMGKAEVIPVDDYLTRYLDILQDIGTVSPDMKWN